MTPPDRLPADLVLEGGGVKGIALVGAALELLGRYRFERVAGSSAGAVLAAFLATGLDAEGVLERASRLEYDRVPDAWAPVPVVAPAIGLLTRSGLHPGRYITEWVRRELADLGVHTFGDLRRDDPGDDPALAPWQRYRLVVTATDVTRGRLLRLPWDYREYGLDPDAQPVADAVRASLAIPYFFAPRTLRNRRTGGRSTLVDGGVLSNFPVETFDRTDGAVPRWPTFGVGVGATLSDEDVSVFPHRWLLPPPLRLLDSLVATTVTARDRGYLAQPCVRRRAFPIDTTGTGLTEFDIGVAERARLIASGSAAAREFLAGWNWEEYLRECRGTGSGRGSGG
ncbi:Patatin [Geodermatophilus sp. DF01-2]|uniref:patatin-like phospholipase family protein n=1 Tax=Geodermatophilus sp. DF01-2 TaxID=2559610 RepID=UPI0010741B0D|nr:patatin-like phospholipase family protein [Geodermatophilus sp. DF01_2]TFV58133.1 Patatin [Geodermatophilus sp. DF01_2]